MTGRPCNTQEETDRRDNKHKGNTWKGVTVEVLKGSGWGPRGGQNLKNTASENYLPMT